MNSELINDLLQTEIPAILWHYTSLPALLGIVSSRSLWATDIRFLNDREEFMHALSIVDELSQEIEDESARGLILDIVHQACESGGLSPERNQFFVISFSAAGDLLSQWRAYTDGVRGVAIGFDLRSIRPPVGTDVMVSFAPCVYRPDKKRDLVRAVFSHLKAAHEEILRESDAIVRAAIEQASSADEGGRWRIQEEMVERVRSGIQPRIKAAALPTINDLARLLPLLKHESFEEEQEWRLVLPLGTKTVTTYARRNFRAGSSSIVPYLEQPFGEEEDSPKLTRIMLASNPEPRRSADGVNSLLSNLSFSNVVIEHSAIPYRSW